MNVNSCKILKTRLSERKGGGLAFTVIKLNHLNLIRLNHFHARLEFRLAYNGILNLAGRSGARGLQKQA